jgi:hypothetical protein
LGLGISRPFGEWNEDDFDVLADGTVVGRIFEANDQAGQACTNHGAEELAPVII